MKICSSCNEEKPLADFSRSGKDRRGIDRLETQCKACKKAKTKAWRAANRERDLVSAAKRRADNREQGRARTAKWKAANPEALRSQRINYHAKKRDAGGKLSHGLVGKLLKLQRGRCACGCARPLGDNYHLDHIMPLALGGTNTDDNIQLLRSECNLRKHAKHPVEFMQSNGFLL